MSSYQSKRIRKYWKQVGGLLIEEFQAIPKKKSAEKQVIEGIIVLGEETRRQRGGIYDFTGKDIIVIHTKKDQVGMQSLGQAFQSREVMMRYQPRSIKTVTICSKPDEEMYKFCKEFDIEMVVIGE